MSFSRIFNILWSIPLLTATLAHANATHTAQVNLDLVEVDAKGKEQVLESTTGDFSLDWNSKKCEIRIKKDQFAYCNLDTASDITNSKGELVMKALPQAHFDGAVIDALIRTMGLQDRSIKNLIGKIVDDTRAERAKGFDLPFYTCGDCEKNGKDLVLFNAYQSFVAREVSINHLYLSGKKLILRMKLQQMKALKGAFNIIGSNNAAEYGH